MVESPSHYPDENPERRERIRKLLNLCDRGLPLPDLETVGYHGTSVHAVQYILEHGVLPPMLREDAGSLFFYPSRPEEYPDLPWDNHNIHSQKDVYEETQGYASNLAGIHHICTSLGLDFDDDTAHDLFADLSGFNIIEPFKLPPDDPFFSRFSQDQLIRIMAEVRQREGFVLGFSQKIMDSFSFLRADDLTEPDFKISCPDGLKLEFLSGIVPLGPYEQAFIDELRQEING